MYGESIICSSAVILHWQTVGRAFAPFHPDHKAYFCSLNVSTQWACAHHTRGKNG